MMKKTTITKEVFDDKGNVIERTVTVEEDTPPNPVIPNYPNPGLGKQPYPTPYIGDPIPGISPVRWLQPWETYSWSTGTNVPPDTTYEYYNYDING